MTQEQLERQFRLLHLMVLDMQKNDKIQLAERDRLNKRIDALEARQQPQAGDVFSFKTEHYSDAAPAKRGPGRPRKAAA